MWLSTFGPSVLLMMLTRTAKSCLSKSSYIMLRWPILLLIPLISMNNFSLDVYYSEPAVIYGAKYIKTSIFLSWIIHVTSIVWIFSPQYRWHSSVTFLLSEKHQPTLLVISQKALIAHCHQQSSVSLFILLLVIYIYYINLESLSFSPLPSPFFPLPFSLINFPLHFKIQNL